MTDAQIPIGAKSAKGYDLAFITGIAIFGSILGYASPENSARSDDWIYSEEVSYQRNHDPSSIALTDGRRLEVAYNKDLTWKIVDRWVPGRPLTYAYSEAQGCVLIDVGSGHQLQVIGGWDKDHPLDLLLKTDMGPAHSTMDMVVGYASNAKRWEVEIRRLYRQLLDMEIVPSEAKKDIEEAQSAWDSFCSAHMQAAASLHRLPDGTKWQITHAQHYHNFVRDHARRLQALVVPPAAAQHIASWDEP